jgi:hypothetical protein
MSEELNGQSEVQETTPEQPKQFTNLEEFQTEMGKLKAAEDAEGKTANFRDLDPTHLIKEDMLVYNIYLTGQMDKTRYDEYRDPISEQFIKARSRRSLCAYIGNMISIEITRKQIEALKRAKNENSA